MMRNCSKIGSTIACVVIGVSAASGRDVTGRVLSDSDSTAVIGAQCELMVDSTVIARGVTDTDGRFRLEAASKEEAHLGVRMIGYSATNVAIPAGGRNIDLGTIFLPEGVELGEVTVGATWTVDSQGRTIIYPSSSDVKASSTAISLFQKLALPGLEVNPITRSISVGTAAPMILINGVPSTMDDVYALQPKDIERVEYSQVTPARYADRGTNGLLNILLKKRDDGGQVYVWMRDCPYIGFLDGNIRMSYHQGPSQFTLSYSPSWRDVAKVDDTVERSYIGDGFKVQLSQTEHSPFMYLTNPIRFKYDYQPSARTLFSATFNADISKDDRKSTGHTDDSILGNYVNHRRSHSKSFTPSLDLFLRHDFNDKNSLEAQMVGTISSMDYRYDNSFTFTGLPEESYVMDVDNRRRSLITEVSYNHHFSSGSSLSAGFQNTLSHSKNTYLTSDYAPVLTENNNYAYVRLGHRIKSVFISLSTGVKMFWMENDLNKRHFIRNLSQAQFNWNASDRFSLGGEFSYQPSIPSLSSLTDYPQQSTPYLISNGNPDLKVSEGFIYKLMPTYNYKKFTVSAELAYYRLNNATVGETFYIGDGHFLNQTVNARHCSDLFANLTLSLKDLYGFGATAGVGVDRYESRGAGWKHTLTSVSGWINVWWSKGPFSVSYWRKFPGKTLYGQTVSRDENADALSFSYTPDKHWTLSAQWMYMFERGGVYYPSWVYSDVAPSVTKRHIKDNANMVMLSVSYSADFGSIFRSSRRSLNNTDTGSSLMKL